MARGHHQCNFGLERLMPKVHAAIGHVGLGNVVALCVSAWFLVGRVCDDKSTRKRKSIENVQRRGPTEQEQNERTNI